MASSSSNIFSFVGFIMMLWSGSLYANGCYTSIISFGDSIADTGNVKHLGSITNEAFPSLFPPYGQTFFHEPTGRCSDGRLIIDFLAESLELPFIPPYMHEGSANMEKFKHGVNFAVAGSTAMNSQHLAAEGIQNAATNASLEVELQWFKHSLPLISGNALDRRNYIGQSLILMGEIGGNDYNIPMRDNKSIEDMELFVPLVVNTIALAINELIEMGAQTLVVPGNFPIGCSPAHLTVMQGSEDEEYDPTTGCLVRLNQFAEYHNQMLQTKLNQIREFHPDVNIIYADYYNAAMQFYRFPNKFGFTNGALKACCGGGGLYNYNSTVTCGHESATVCDEPDRYVSWDGVHLTEAAYKVIFKGLFQGPYTTPAYSSLCPASSQMRVGLSSSS
ncbi:hypothetical protein SSX86_006984 [Deinandra increscens subsp. villosa]|uniref:Uncharacterized protein n=1 Tax=Deinandra increscens subsp. villosa TaxID=3103831 RepID=A0AAP0H723_9ASTR